MAAGSVLNALSPDPTWPTRRTVAGIPVLVSSAVEPNVVWGIDTSRTHLVVLDDAIVETDRSVFFASDRVAVKATMRVGFAFAHAASVVKSRPASRPLVWGPLATRPYAGAMLASAGRGTDGRGRGVGLARRWQHYRREDAQLSTSSNARYCASSSPTSNAPAPIGPAGRKGNPPASIHPESVS